MTTDTEDIVVNIDSLPNSEAVKAMMDAGVFFGRKKSKTNPKMKPYILANRGGVEVIDLQKTQECIEAAEGIVKEKVRQGGLVLFVGVHPGASRVQEIAQEFGMPVVFRRWIGGTLTNFKTVSLRLEYFKKLRDDLASGALKDKYTKKERLQMEREVARLAELFGGIEPMTRLPDLMVVVDPPLHMTAVREAERMSIPVVGFGSTDTDPDQIAYLVPGNAHAKASIDWFLDKIASVIREGRTLAAALAAAMPKEATGENGGN